jgi:hypothetical protein
MLRRHDPAPDVCTAGDEQSYEVGCVVRVRVDVGAAPGSLLRRTAQLYDEVKQVMAQWSAASGLQLELDGDCHHQQQHQSQTQQTRQQTQQQTQQQRIRHIEHDTPQRTQPTLTISWSGDAAEGFDGEGGVLGHADAHTIVLDEAERLLLCGDAELSGDDGPSFFLLPGTHACGSNPRRAARCSYDPRTHDELRGAHMTLEPTTSCAVLI